MSKKMEWGVVPALMAAMAACAGAGPTSNDGGARLVLSVSSRSAQGAPQTAPETIGLGTDVLVIDQVDVVLREIELERAGADGCDDNGGATSSSGSGDNGNNSGDDDCEEIDVGPLLVSLTLAGSAATRIEVPLQPGTYDEVEFEVHKPDDDDGRDVAFLAAHPDFRRVSIRARGTFNGSPFVFETDLNVEQEVRLSPPLVVEEGATVELALTIDVRRWFLDAAGTRLVNPASALKGEPNEGLVKLNIIKSIDAERDDHHDD